jgi:hypothetical protein
MRLTDEQMQKALKNLNITKDLIACGSIAANVYEAKFEGKKIQMFGEDNIPQLIATFEDLIYYKARVEEMQKTLEWYADEHKYMTYYESGNFNGWEVSKDRGARARQALKGVTNEQSN